MSADRYLNQFSQELDAGLDRRTDLKSLGRDLALVRDAIDDRLDVVIASYNGAGIKRSGLFATSIPVDRSVPALRAEIGRLALKHELLAFGEYSLQAGIVAKDARQVVGNASKHRHSTNKTLPNRYLYLSAF